MAINTASVGSYIRDPGMHAVTGHSTAVALRFVQRGDKRILQQEWINVTNYSDGSCERSVSWRDVPLFDDDKAPPVE